MFNHLIDGSFEFLGDVRRSLRHLRSGLNDSVRGSRTSETAGSDDEDCHLVIKADSKSMKGIEAGNELIFPRW